MGESLNGSAGGNVECGMRSAERGTGVFTRISLIDANERSQTLNIEPPCVTKALRGGGIKMNLETSNFEL